MNELIKTDKEYILQLENQIEQLKKRIDKSEAESFSADPELLRSIVQNMPVMFDALDDQGNILMWNRECERITGYSQEEMINSPNAFKLLYPDEVYLKQLLSDVEEHQVFQDWEMILTCKDGIKKTIAWSSNSKLHPIPGWTWWAIGVDVSERKHSEELLRKSENKYRELVDSVNSIILLLNSDAIIEYINPYACDFFGFKKEELIGQSVIGKLVPMTETTGRDLKLMVKDAFAHPENYLANINENIKKDGTRVWISWTNSIMTDENNNSRGLLSVGNDITQSKENECTRLRAQKMESISLLAGGIAHDFNNLLVGILGNANLIQMDSTNKEILELANEIEQAANRANKLTKQLLTFSKGGAPIKKPTSIRKVVEDAVSLATRGSPSKAEYNISTRLSPVDADAGQIAQVITNITINAVQSMPKGGIITVTMQDEIIENLPQNELSPGNYVKISIQDEGEGIPSQYHHQIFDPYFTTKKTGNGLGLATSYSIMQQHQGKITFVSERDMGTTFTIYLPVSNQPLEKVVPESKPNQNYGGKILIMDDDPIVSRTLGSMLSKLGVEVDIAHDGTEAIRKYKEALQYKNKFSAIITDLTIPGGLGGKDTIKNLLTIDPTIIAIVSSGYSNDPIMANYQDYGFKGILKKPYSLTQLKKLLSEIGPSEKKVTK